MKIRICHLYPDALNLYGDRGNVLCMQRRLSWRGIECETESLRIGDNLDLSRFDLFFMGGGQDFEQEVLLSDLHRQNGREIKAAVTGRHFYVSAAVIRSWGRIMRQRKVYDANSWARSICIRSAAQKD